MYLGAKREARQVVRNAKYDEWIRMGECLQQDFVKNQRSFWRKIRTATKGSDKVGRVCDENGQVLCEEDEVRARWKDYFESLLQTDVQPQQGGSREVPGEEGEMEESVEEITLEEIRRNIGRLKNRKAPGVCGISGEMLKAGGDIVVEWMHKIVNTAWRSGKVPGDWRKALVIPVHKKGSN